MSNQRASFAKREREKQKKERAAAKRERRLERASAETEEVQTGDAGLTNDALIEQIAQLHAAFDDGRIDHETFEEQRDRLMAQLSI
jgi:guanylate kinase